MTKVQWKEFKEIYIILKIKDIEKVKPGEVNN